MKESSDAAIRKYEKLAADCGFEAKLMKVSTPFIDTNTVDPDEDCRLLCLAMQLRLF